MMTLYERICTLFPDLTYADFHPITGTISLRNDSDGRGDYIERWEHPTLPRPTDEELAK